MTAYYPTLKVPTIKPGGYGATLSAPKPPAPPQTPQVPAGQPAGGYGATIQGVTARTQPINTQGHPTGDLGAGASTAATMAGQNQQQAQNTAMATASAKAADPFAHLDPATAARYRQQMAAAAGMGASANAASTAASTAGQRQESAQANQMATASTNAAKVQPPPQMPQSAPLPPTFSGTLEKQGPLTEAGGLYDGYVTDVLKGDRAIAGVDSARSDSERRNALNYSHTLQQAQEAAAQSGLQPGTAGYNRIIQEAMSGVSSQNLDRTNSVNQLQRQGYQDILGLGKGIEDTAYGRATDERNYKTERADTGYTRGVNERAYTDERGDIAYGRGIDERTYADNRGDVAYNRGIGERAYTDERGDITYNRSKTDTLQAKTEKMAAINAIEDPKARQAALNAYLREQGDNSTYGAILGMYNADGSLKPEFQSQNPAQGDYQQRIAELKAYYPGKTEAELQAMAVAEREQERTTARAPIDKAQSDAEQASIKEKIRLGQPITPEEKTSAIAKETFPEFTAANLPTHPEDPAFKELVGKSVNIGGNLYTVVKSISPRTGHGTTTLQGRHTDVAVVTDEAGKTKYIWGGNISDTPPKEVDLYLTPWGF